MDQVVESRRVFLRSSAEFALGYGLLQLGFRYQAWAGTAGREIERWAQRIAILASDVRGARLSPQQWQHAIEQLHSTMRVDDIIAALDVETVVKAIKFPVEKLGAIHNIRLPGLAGQNTNGFGQKLFIYRKGASTPPHAHNHLVSAHLILRGQIRTRKFNRLKDEVGAIVIEPTVDGVFGPGHTDSMSDEENNVHWFEGVSDVAVTFDVPVTDIRPERKYGVAAEAYNQIYLDPTGRARGDGRIVAPVISFRDAARKFG